MKRVGDRAAGQLLTLADIQQQSSIGFAPGGKVLGRDLHDLPAGFREKIVVGLGGSLVVHE